MLSLLFVESVLAREREGRRKPHAPFSSFYAELPALRADFLTKHPAATQSTQHERSRTVHYDRLLFEARRSSPEPAPTPTNV